MGDKLRVFGEREYLAFEDGIRGINAYPTFGEPKRLAATIGKDAKALKLVKASSKLEAIRKYRTEGVPFHFA